MRIAIVDDVAADREHLAADVVRWAERQGMPLDEPPTQLESGEVLLESFVPGQYGVIFLDIYMDGIDGMEVARRIRAQDTDCRLVFITNSSDFAVESYEVNSSWYLVKPYTAEKLEQAMNRCNMLEMERNRYLKLPGRYGPERVRLHDIAWTEYESRKIHVHFKNGEETWISMNHREFSHLLLRYSYFCDCMKGLIVSFEAVEKLQPDHFVLRGGQNIPISRLKYREVRERFSSYSYDRARAGEDYAGDS